MAKLKGSQRKDAQIANGKEHPLDVLICATGFDTLYKPRFPLIGTGGANLADKWADKAKYHLGLAVTGFPSYFMVILTVQSETDPV
jgi:cation diffusion facilitator CzcD-associated flavoprotein CzcO